ncbi:unnamed protein product [Rotaria sordida]|uniref:Flavin-containing monooxygenase n=3 Tax=Rotaria sordida TaxID=392033 RepID=A0A814NWM9_9BILA|nr:unnamed protein product [Rotaria sordida]
MLGVGFIFYYYLTILRSSLLPLLPLPSSTSSSSSTASSSPSPSLTLMSSTLPPTQYKVVEMNDRVPSFKLATNSGKPPYADGDRAQTAIINSLQLVEKLFFEMKKKKFAVIGGGWSGLYALKYLLEENLDTQLYERESNLGGVWFYKETPGGVYQSTHTTSSKTYLHASDFPLPDDTPHFPKHDQILAYLNSYRGVVLALVLH